MLNSSSNSVTGADGRMLTTGFYQLTLIAGFLSSAEIDLRASPSLPNVSLLELVVVPALLCLLAELWFRPRLRARAVAIYRQNRPLVWYGCYAAISSVVGLVRSSDTLRSFHDLFVAVALYVLVSFTATGHLRMTRILMAVLGGAMVNVGLALLQIGSGGPYLVSLSANIASKLDTSGEAAANFPTGLYSHPNGLAVFLMPVVLFLLVGIWAGFRATPRRGLLLAALLVITLFVLKKTYAKGVYAWLVVGGLFLVLPRRFDRHRAWLAMTASIAGIAAITWVSFAAFLDGDLVFGTIVSRIELWLATLNIVQTDVFVATFGGGGSQLADQSLVTFEYSNAHNAWLDQALTYGVPALVLYLSAYATAFRSLAHRIQLELHPIRTLALAVFASLAAILGESFFEPTNHGVVFQGQLFLLFAFAACLPSPRYPGPHRVRNSFPMHAGC